ncbi:unnamed protein product [Ixodes pacificus]
MLPSTSLRRLVHLKRVRAAKAWRKARVCAGGRAFGRHVLLFSASLYFSKLYSLRAQGNGASHEHRQPNSLQNHSMPCRNDNFREVFFYSH